MSAAVQHLPANLRGRDFVVGDIHGMFDDLARSLELRHFDPAADRLLSVGDLVDRGPKSTEARSWLAQPWFHAVAGNHEALAIGSYAAARQLLDAGEEPLAALRTLRRYGVQSVPAERLDLLMPLFLHVVNGGSWMLDHCQEASTADTIAAMAALPLAMEVASPTGERYGISHADIWARNWPAHCARLVAGDPRAVAFAQWSRRTANCAIRRHAALPSTPAREAACTVRGIDQVFVGHTVVYGGPVRRGNYAFIDTGAPFPKGTLSLVQVTGDR